MVVGDIGQLRNKQKFRHEGDKLPPGEKDRALRCMEDYEQRVRAGTFYAKN
jgi:hypothetical protein